MLSFLFLQTIPNGYILKQQHSSQRYYLQNNGCSQIDLYVAVFVVFFKISTVNGLK